MANKVGEELGQASKPQVHRSLCDHYDHKIVHVTKNHPDELSRKFAAFHEQHLVELY
jgi:hypothetical protein